VDRVISAAKASSSEPHAGTSTKAAELLGFRVYQVPFVGNRAVDVIGDKSAGVRMAFRICEKGASDFAAGSAGLL
jgi:hypothetical protein